MTREVGPLPHLNTRWVSKNGRPVFFSGVRKGKGYVSFYLMPVYVCPVLVKGMSAGLKKHMQGKSCLNSTAADRTLFRELARLTKPGLAEFRGRYSVPK